MERASPRDEADKAGPQNLSRQMRSQPGVMASGNDEPRRELRRRCNRQMRERPSTICDFVERHEDRDQRQLTFPAGVNPICS